MADQLPMRFDTYDKLERRAFSQQLEAFMATEHHFIEDGALVISLNGVFGSGKTTFLEMWRNEIVERRKDGVLLPVPIILNAWESDFSGDPLLAILSAISTALGQDREEKEQQRAELIREAAKDIGNFTLGLAGSFVKQTGLDPISAGKFAEEKKAARKDIRKHSSLLTSYEAKLSARNSLKQVLKKAFGGNQLNALIMVDELDRCRPNYAIDYLETIKHVFDVHGLAFVLAVDKGQLESSAKALFGTSLNFPEYYRKFAHRDVDLPAPSGQGINLLAQHYAKTILEVTQEQFRRSSMLKLEDRLSDIIKLTEALKLQPRQIRETFRTMGHLLAGDETKRGQLRWGYGAGAILMSALSVAKPDIYRNLGTGTASPADFEQIFGLFNDDSERQWWGAVIFTGYSNRNREDVETLISQFVRIGALAKEMLNKGDRRDLGQFAVGWGHHNFSAGLKTVFENLEALKSFGTA